MKRLKIFTIAITNRINALLCGNVILGTHNKIAYNITDKKVIEEGDVFKTFGIIIALDYHKNFIGNLYEFGCSSLIIKTEDKEYFIIINKESQLNINDEVQLSLERNGSGYILNKNQESFKLLTFDVDR